MGTLLRQCRNEVMVDAVPQAVWVVVADPTRVGEWSHETRSASWLDGATEAVAGARFAGRNVLPRNRWSRVNEVLEVVPGRSITWRTVPSRLYRDSTEWTIAIEPDGAGTRITQSYRVLQLGWFMDRLFYAITPEHRDRRPALRADLVRIGERAAAITV